MAEEADKAINTALLHGSPSMAVRPKKEIAYVAAVTLGGIRGIADAWRPILSGYGLAMRLAGVYCHAAPIVRFAAHGRTRNCELADLLVVADVRKSTVLTRRAALVQAKMARAKDRVSLTGPSTNRQLHLYQNWPLFDFIDAAYHMTQVNLRVGAHPFLSGTFGVIDPRFNGQPRWTQHNARPTPAIIQRNDHQLGHFIAEMADGARSGFGRLATPSLKTDWSKTVELLLSITYARAFTDKETFGGARPPRGANAAVCYGSGAKRIPKLLWSAISKGPPLGIIPEQPEREPHGISVIHIEIGSDSD